MTDKEISLKSIIFLVIGILLLLSLVICVYLINDEKDLVKISATVTNVTNDNDGTGKNNITVSYNIDNIYYDYSFNYKDNINVNDKVDIYYHEKNPVSVQAYKTSKGIFICPIVGLILCIIGLIELTKKSNANELGEDFETKVISVNGDTQQLKIITETSDEETIVNMEEDIFDEDVKFVNTRDIPIIEEEQIKIETPTKKPTPIEFKEPTKKKNIKNKEMEKVIPKDFYVNKNALVYEVLGNEAKEINLEDIEKVIKTINSEDELVKISVLTKDINCVLTNMKNIDLDNIGNLLHNKLIAIDENFKEEIEHKEY